MGVNEARHDILSTQIDLDLTFVLADANDRSILDRDVLLEPLVAEDIHDFGVF